MCKRTRASRVTIYVKPQIIESFTQEDGLWFETADEIRKQLEWGDQKARLFRWLRKRMRTQLTPNEQRAIECYYFKGMTMLATGKANKTSVATVSRNLKRALNKLKAAAAEREKVLMHRRQKTVK